MKIRLLSSVLALVITLCGANFSVLNAASHKSEEHEDHTPLGEEMETISKTFRTIRRQARDPEKNAASAELVGKMIAAAKEAINHDPAWTEHQPAGEQADFVKGYKAEMEKFIGLLVDLEKAFQSDNSEAAQEIIGQLRDQQKKSHKAYKMPDED